MRQLGIKCFCMLENLKAQVKRLIAAYESEKQQKIKLGEELRTVNGQNEALRKRIIELERELDNLKLKEAFATDGNNDEAKKRVDALIREIDKCISLMEG